MIPFVLLILSCSRGPEPVKPDAGPTEPATMAIAVSVPLSGPGAALGRAALDGVRLAVPPGLDIVEIDEEKGDPVPVAVDNPHVIGVVAHITAVGAERWGRGWVDQDLAVVSAAPASVEGLPRVLAGADRHVRCATAFLGRGDILVVHDGTDEATTVANAAERALERRSHGIRAIDPRLMANEADRVRTTHPDWIVFAGQPGDGGNLLRALRQLGGRSQFLGIGLYDPRFVAAAGSGGEGAIVTSQDRPALDDGVRSRWGREHVGDPPAVALNAYDAARMLVEAWATASAPSRAALRGAVKARLSQVQIQGAAGPMHLDDEGVADPAWCTAFQVHDGALVSYGVARVSNGRVETVDIEAERARERAAHEAAQHAPPN